MKLKIKARDFSFFSVSLFSSVIMLVHPLIFTNGYYNITETKAVFYSVCAVILLVSTAVFSLLKKLMSDKGPELKPAGLNMLDISMLVFGVLVLIAGILSQYTKDVWFGGNSRYQGVIAVLLYIAVYFAVSRGYKFSMVFAYCSIAALCIVSAFGVLNCFDIDLLGIYSEISSANKKIYISTIGNINFYSSYMCLLFPFVLCIFSSEKKSPVRTVCTAALFIASFGMMVTASESFVIGFVFSVLVMPFFFMSKPLRLKRFLCGIVIILMSAQLYRLIHSLAPVRNVKISQLLRFLLHPAVTGILIAVCLAVIILLHRNEGNIKYIRVVYSVAFTVILLTIVLLFILANTRGIGDFNKYFKITERWGTRRGAAWMQCVGLFKEFSLKEKLFGTGPETLYHLLVATGSQAGKNLDQAHNEYLQYLLTTGIFGLISYVSVIISTVTVVVKKLKEDIFAAALLAGLIAFWFQSVVNMAQPFTTPIMYLFVSLIGGMYYKKRGDNEAFAEIRQN